MKKILMFCMILCCTLPLSNQVKKQEAAVLQPDIAARILRFHVRANSDSQADQKLKLEVRDAIGAKMQTLLKESKNRAQSEQIIQSHKKEIKVCAQDILREHGCTDDVQVSLEDTEFPEKTYGAFTFPKGQYRALVIELGKAKGHNWWCVMYPNLCFADSVYEEPKQADNADLKKVLTPAEYDSIIRQDNMQIRCRYATVLNPVLERLCGSDRKETKGK
ncbi:MAG: stage II sporulation protein R [Lachnospiraceae bacterium]